jgi:phosphoglycolate phosphatase-like HAD superfamily hydrolase
MLTPMVALFDVDNTLLDNDRFSRELDAHLADALGPGGRAAYRTHYEQLRAQRGYADYLAPLQLMRRQFEDDADLIGVSGFLLDYPFAECVYDGAAAALEHVSGFATTAILSDGDIVFQPHKIRRSGLCDRVGGRMLVTLHKDRELESVQRRLPAAHYVLVDDKPALLDRAKAVLGDMVTTVFVRQGHYAIEADADRASHPPDLRLDSIAGLAAIPPKDLQ